MKQKDRAALIVLIIAAGFWLGVVSAYIFGYYKGAPFPKNTFLCLPSDFGNDFFNLFEAVKVRDPYSFLSLYLPFSYIPIFPLTVFPPQVAYILFVSAFCAVVFHLCFTHLLFLGRYERLAASFVIVFLSYPVVFELDRGNFEAMLFTYIYLFLRNYERGNTKWCVFFLACASAMKAYPFVFVVLFLDKRQYKPVIATAILAAGLTVGSAAVYPGGIQGTLHALARNAPLFKQIYVLGDGGLPYTMSYYGLIKIVAAWISHPLSAQALERFLPFYTIGGLAFFAVTASYVLFYERVLWKKVTVLTCSMLLLPQVVIDYKLMHLLLPMMLFVAYNREGARDVVYTLLFGLLLIPKTFVWLSYSANLQVLPASNVLNPLLMTALIGLIICENFAKGSKTAPLQVPDQRTRSLGDGQGSACV